MVCGWLIQKWQNIESGNLWVAKLLLAKWKRCKISRSHQTPILLSERLNSKQGGAIIFTNLRKPSEVDIFTASKANFISAMLWFWVKKGGSWHQLLSEISYSVSEKIFPGLRLNWSQPHNILGLIAQSQNVLVFWATWQTFVWGTWDCFSGCL